MAKAKRRITKFDFEAEGAHCALVDSGANMQTVLTMKALNPTPDLASSVDNQGGDVVAVNTEDDTTNTEEEVNKMSEENKVTDQTVQDMIKKALADQEAIIRKSLTDEFEAKDKERAAELDILKAKEEAREEKAFIAKAAEFKTHLASEETEQHEAVQSLAKALRKMEEDADCKPALDLLKSLKETVEKSALLDEMGSTSSVEKNAGYETEGDKMVMKMVKEQGVTEATAYAKLLTERPELFS